jgi:uncharacterized RDD family membrane protein YckC
LAQLGPYGRLIGFCVCLIYFGFFNSNFGRGRTIGQRLAKIKVVDAQGDYISLGKSLIRAAILWLPMSLNNLAVPTSALLTQPVVFALLGAIVFGLGGALVYLFLFNKKSRQSIHDLIVGAFVVRSDTVQMPAPAPIWRGHVIILLSLFAVLSTAALVTGPMLLKQSTFKGMLDVVQAIEKSGDVFSCEVAEQTNFGGTAGSAINQQKMLIVSAVCKHNPKEEAGTINKLVALVVKTYPKVLELDGLEIELNYGYDIGIASGWQNDSRDLTQAQLLELTGLPAPTELPSVSEEHLEPPKHGERGERGIRRTGRTHSRSEVKRH